MYQQNKFHYAVWQLLLYYYREFPAKILSVHVMLRKNNHLDELYFVHW